MSVFSDSITWRYGIVGVAEANTRTRHTTMTTPVYWCHATTLINTWKGYSRKPPFNIQLQWQFPWNIVVLCSNGYITAPVVNSKERTRIATPWSTWRCTLVLSTTVRKVCGLSCILMKFSTLIHVICYNIMPIPCVFVWGLRIDDLSIYVYSNLLKNWSPVHTIPYCRPQPI